jgi:hypothetical protein
MQEFTVKRLQPYAHEVRFEYTSGDVFWILLTSDRHWDNPHSDHDLQKKHLEQAVECGAPVIDHGDLFDAMQSTHDPRRDYDSLRGEHKGRDYLDRLCDTALGFFEPYAEVLVKIHLGNHEKAILDNNNTNLIQRLAARLTDRTGSSVDAAPMEGWTRFRFEHKSGGNIKTLKMYSHHGWGGSARVTKGTIKSNRRAAMVSDAHIVCTGHIHQSWELPLIQKHLTSDGRQIERKQLHIQLPSYKRETKNMSGYHVEKGREPRPIGARWLRVEVSSSDIHYTTLEAE